MAGPTTDRADWRKRWVRMRLCCWGKRINRQSCGRPSRTCCRRLRGLAGWRWIARLTSWWRRRFHRLAGWRMRRLRCRWRRGRPPQRAGLHRLCRRDSDVQPQSKHRRGKHRCLTHGNLPSLEPFPVAGLTPVKPEHFPGMHNAMCVMTAMDWFRKNPGK